MFFFSVVIKLQTDGAVFFFSEQIAKAESEEKKRHACEAPTPAVIRKMTSIMVSSVVQ